MQSFDRYVIQATNGKYFSRSGIWEDGIEMAKIFVNKKEADEEAEAANNRWLVLAHDDWGATTKKLVITTED